MQAQPSVIATGDFLYFAPAGQAFTIPAAGTVGAAAKPDPTDPIWTTFALGTVKKATQDKLTAKATKISAPMPGTGIIVDTNIIRSQRELVIDVEMNEISRVAMAAFYQSGLIAIADTSFHPLGGPANFLGWLKRQRYDSLNGLWIVDDMWTDVVCTDITATENVLNPKFQFTWLYSALAGSAI